MNVNIGQWLARRAFMTPTREAYVDGDTGLRLSFADFILGHDDFGNLAQGEPFADLLPDSLAHPI